MAEFLNLVWNTLDSVFSWMELVYGRWSISYTGLLLAMFAIMALCRYILKPFVGSGLSDSARKDKKNANNS